MTDILKINIEKLIDRLVTLAKRDHYTCEDEWYACPKSPDGCGNEMEGNECNYGADSHNAEVDEISKSLNELFTSKKIFDQKLI